MRVAPESAFVLTSAGTATAVEIARSVLVQPSIELSTAPATDGSVVLRPTAPLEPGLVYRFAARAPDGSLVGSWAFQVASPLRVVGTLPGNEATAVPVTTGVELTVDHDGTLDAAGHFSIAPRVDGTLEQHGRTLVFVPDRLAPATVYTVTLSRGVVVRGSSQGLERDVQFRFETAGPEERPGETAVFDRAMIEATPAEPAVLAFASWSPDRSEVVDRSVAVYELPSAAAALAAVSTLATAPAWAMWSSAGLVPTAGLRRVVSFVAHPQNLGDAADHWFRLPTPLPVGWYLVSMAGDRRDAQALLQVTDVATFSAVSTTRTVVWANDARTGSPLSDAAVRLGSLTLGRTDGDGLLDVPTPEGLADRATETGQEPAVLTVVASDGRVAYVPLTPGGGGDAYPWEISQWGGADDNPWWHLLATDRLVYRSTDTINTWGLVRSREGASPASAELRFLVGSLYSSTGAPDAPPMATRSVALDANGVFTGQFPVTDLPTGAYAIELLVEGTAVATRMLRVDAIRKPAYQVTLATDRRALVADDPVTLSADVRFFDGTPVSGAPLAVGFFTQSVVNTDGDGRATATRRASVDGNQGWQVVMADVSPARAEDGEISGSTSVLVFPGSHWVEGAGSIAAGRGVVTGSVHEVALDRLQAFDSDAFGSIDPKGDPVAGAGVTAVITELVPNRTRTIEGYDFIEKRVVETYDYTIERQDAGRTRVVSGPDGSFRIEFPAATGNDYEVELRTADDRGRTMAAVVYAGKPFGPARTTTRPYLGRSSVCGHAVDSYATGQPISLTMRDGNGPLPEGGANRYLFLTAQQGIRSATVQGSATYASRFTSADAPDISIAGVRFTGHTYSPAIPTIATLKTDERSITVSLAADRPRYAPGDSVRLSIRTSDATGRATPASVVVRVVDEKLYAIGDAMAETSLDDLYSWVSPAIVWSHSSHPLPLAISGWGCGDTTGGGGTTGGSAVPRQDFRDWLLFDRVRTGADGAAQLAFALSDDVTSWHVAATALTSGLGAGDADLLVPVGLPFFVEATIAPEYLLADRPTLRVRAFGSALRDGDPVAFVVSSPSLGLPRTTFTGAAFRDVEVPLPALALGSHAVTIEGSSARGRDVVRDSIVRTFRVVESRLTRSDTAYFGVTAGLRPAPGPGLATYVFSDAGRGRYLGRLFALASSAGARVDRALAASIARDLLVERFDVPGERVPASTFDPTAYQDQGIALVPYASPDLALSARVALLAPDRFDAAALREQFTGWRDDGASTREQRVIAEAGLAALGADVLGDLRSWAGDPALTMRERLYAALGLTALGDAPAALSAIRSVLAASGERLGPWIRLRVGTSLDDTIEATALAALVAARVGDPVGDALEEYVAQNEARDDLYSLQEVAFIQATLDRLPAATGRFSFTVAGRRHVVDLGAGDGYVLTLAPAEQASLVLDPLQGSVSVAITRDVPVRAVAVQADPALRLQRTLSSPAGAIRSDAPLEVTLTATFGLQAVDGCYTVTDLVPSGLIAVTNVAAWPSPDAPISTAPISPSSVDGQRVQFCAYPDARHRIVRMHYYARVATGGAYLWEPAVLQSDRAADSMAITASVVITAR